MRAQYETVWSMDPSPLATMQKQLERLGCRVDERSVVHQKRWWISLRSSTTTVHLVFESLLGGPLGRRRADHSEAADRFDGTPETGRPE